MTKNIRPFNNSGFSILEALISIGIISLISVAMISLTSAQDKQIKLMSQKIAINDLKNSFLAVMQDPAICAFNLSPAGLTFDSNSMTNKSITVPSIKIGQVASAPVLIQAGQDLDPNSKIRIVSIVLDDLIDAGSGRWSGIWKINLANNFSSYALRPITLNRQTFDVDVTSPTLSKITDCHGVSGGGATGPWEALADDIFFETGKVGIGTNTPTSVLHTVAGGLVGADFIGNLLTTTATSADPGLRKLGLDVQSTGIWNGAGATNTGLNVNVSGGTTNYAATFSGGNVGIGTTSPAENLDIVGFSARLANNSSALFKIQSAIATQSGYPSLLFKSSRGDLSVPSYPLDGDNLGTILFGNQNENLIGAQIQTIAKGNHGVAPDRSGGELQFWTSPSGTKNLAKRMVISDAGNVGIGTGTTTPVYRADIRFTSPVVYTSSSATADLPGLPNDSVQIYNNSLATGSGSFIRIGATKADTTTQMAYLGAITNNTSLYTPDIVFGSRSGLTSYSEKMRIDSSGKVGIGTDAPQLLLHVGKSTVSSGTAVAAFQNIDGICSITPASSGSGIACSSDENLKENFRDVNGSFALEKILQLQAVTYNFKTSSVENRRTGFKAQEIKRIAPEFVRVGENGMLQVFYDAFIPWITEGIKELYHRITDIETVQLDHGSQIQSQAREIASINSRFAQILSDNEKLKKTLDSQMKENLELKFRLEKIERKIQAR